MIGKSLGPYRLLERLGSGGMGTVYLAEGPDGRVAVKVVHPHLLERPGQFKRFLGEILGGRRVDHPNVVRTLDGDMVLIDGEPWCYLVMEVVEGKTLRDLADELGPLPEDLVREIGIQVAAGLAEIHRLKIIHRDVKPENLLITPDQTVKVMDLGIARIREGLTTSRTGQFVGTILYAGPERFQSDAPPIDARTDLFSLGVVLHELAAGLHPFHCEGAAQVIQRILHHEPPPLRDLRPDLSPVLDRLVRRLLSKDPDGRPPSADAVVAKLSGDALAADTTTTLGRRSRRPSIARSTAVHGREKELARLRSIFKEVDEGRGRVLIVEGQVGLGKTRLVDQLAADLIDEGIEYDLLLGAYPPGGAAAGLKAFSEAFRERLGFSDPSEEVRRLLPPGAALAGPFAAFLRGEPPRLGGEPLPRESLTAAFSQTLKALAETTPVLLLIDDLHFAPPEGLALFADLAADVAEHRVLLAGTTREALPDTWRADVGRLDQVEDLKLEPLTGKAVESMLLDLGCSGQAAGALGPRIAARSGGVPYFTLEIVRELIETDALVPDDDGRLVAGERLDSIRIPPTVTRLLEARLAVLPDEDRSLLEVAACCGAAFDPLLVARSLELPRIQVLQDLSRMEKRHGLVRAAGRRFVFDHGELREVLVDSLPEALREEYHALLATAIEEDAGADGPDGAAAVELCDHLLRSGRPIDDRLPLGRALDHLEHTYRHAQAFELSKKLLAAGKTEGAPRVDLLLRAADQLEPGGHYDEIPPLVSEALRIAEEDGDKGRAARARTVFGRMHSLKGDLRRARETLESAVAEAADAGETEIELVARTELGTCLHHLGESAEAEAQYLTVRDQARQAGNPQREAKALGNLGLLMWQRGENDEARDRFEGCLTVFREIGDRRAEASAVGLLGLVLDDEGHHAEAAEMHRSHLDAARDIGYRRGMSIAMTNLGDSLRTMGKLGEARRWFTESGRISEEIGDRAGVITSDINAASLHRWLGDLETAREHAEKALTASREIGAKREEGLTLEQMAAIAMEKDRPEIAIDRAAEAIAVYRGMDFLAGAGEALLVQGEALLSLGRAEEARGPLTEAADAGRKTGQPYLEVMATCNLARADAEDSDKAAARLAEHLDSLGLHPPIEAFYALWLATGDWEHLRQARERLDLLLDAVEPEFRSALKDGLGLYRRIANS